MRTDLGELLYTFAVISDSHVNEAEDRSASPYASNRSANGRLRYVVRILEALDPAFVVHLGDMGNPLPHLTTYGEAAEAFREITSGLRCPLHLLPGNHCVGDKPVGWVPVPRVSRSSLELFEQHYGALYSSFDHGPCHFVMLNALLINSGLKLEQDQRRWLQKDLRQASLAGRRIWLMTHYPPYVTSPDEPSGYDNLDEPGRTWLLELLVQHSVEAVYSGHVHNLFYNRYVDTEIHTLPATSFVRQDYSDMFSVEPADVEGGRDDGAKLGYCLVRVYERGHTSHVLRTHGRVIEPEGGAPGEKGPTESAVALMPIGVEIRENWLARATLRDNNSISPFVRRWARNDWPLLALEEMGISKLRVALEELAREDVLDRMATLRDKGYEFAVYSYGIPTERQYRLVRERRSLLASWELVLGLDQIKAVAQGIARLASGPRGTEPLPCYLSEVRDIAKGQTEDANVKHEANYGFQVEEKRRIAGLLRSGPIVETFTGLVFRLRRRGEPVRNPWQAIHEVGQMGQKSGMRHQVHVLFSGSLTADRMLDDASSSSLVAEATVAAWVTGNVDIYFDTFEDVDRGYFVRNGLVDRRYNPRLAAKVLHHLGEALAQHDPTNTQECSTVNVPRGRLWRGVLGGRFCSLLLPRPRCRLDAVDAPSGVACSSMLAIDLRDGRVFRIPASTADGTVHLAEPLVASNPVWLQAD